MDDPNNNNQSPASHTPGQQITPEPVNSVAPANPLGEIGQPTATPPVAPSSPFGANPQSKPAAFMDPTSPATPPQKAAGGKKKLGVLALIVVLVVALVGGGGAYAYTTVQNNKPEAVMAKSLGNTFGVKKMLMSGSMKVTSNDGVGGDLGFEIASDQDAKAYELKLNIGNIKAENMDLSKIKVGMDFRVIKEDAYFKIDNLTQSIEAAYGAIVDAAGPEAKDAYGLLKDDIVALANKITDKWVKIPNEAFKAGDYQCLMDSTSSELSKNDQKTLVDAYKQNPFATLKKKNPNETVNGVSAKHYTMTLDKAKAENFGKSFEKLELTKKVNDCADKLTASGQKSSTDNDSSSDDKTKYGDMEVYVGGKPQRLVKFTMPVSDDSSKGTLDLNFKYDQAVKVDVPADAMSWDEFLKLVENAINESAIGQSYLEDTTPAGLGSGLVQTFTDTLTKDLSL